MKIGQCYQCGKKIGRRSANGHFSYDPDEMRQMRIHYKRSRETQGKNEDGSPKTVDEKRIVHVPVCKTCLGTPNIALIETNLQNDGAFKQFKKEFPNVAHYKVEEEQAPKFDD